MKKCLNEEFRSIDVKILAFFNLRIVHNVIIVSDIGEQIQSQEDGNTLSGSLWSDEVYLHSPPLSWAAHPNRTLHINDVTTLKVQDRRENLEEIMSCHT